MTDIRQKLDSSYIAIPKLRKTLLEHKLCWIKRMWSNFAYKKHDVLPLREKSTALQPNIILCLLKQLISLSALRSNIRRVASSEPDANVSPHGWNFTVFMSDSWPSNAWTHCPFRTSHIIAIPSQLYNSVVLSNNEPNYILQWATPTWRAQIRE